jgi:trk system potassium uptake protein
MKISIIGAGEIGEHLAGMLSKENRDVIILDSNPEIISKVASNHDVLAINGNATSISDLQRAQVADADLVIAVTNVDEVNMLACLISKRLGAKKTIARIRNAEYSDVNSPVSPSEIGVDVVISPEKSIASDIFQLIKRAAARDVIPLADGKLQLIGLRISPGSTLVNKSLEELASSLFPYDFRIAAIQRGVRTILPDGKSKIVKNDNVFVLLHSKDVPDFIEKSGYKKNSLKNIMIAGGGLVGRNVLHHLMNDSEKWNVKLIEPDKEKCISLATKYKKTLVLHGNSNDPNLLATEGIMDMDIFIKRYRRRGIEHRQLPARETFRRKQNHFAGFETDVYPFESDYRTRLRCKYETLHRDEYPSVHTKRGYFLDFHTLWAIGRTSRTRN